MVKQTIMPLNNQVRQTHLSRLYFLSKGCKQVPLDLTGGKVLWAHPEGYFVNAQGQKICQNFSPSMQGGIKDAKGHKIGSCYPIMRGYSAKLCHHLMALAFYGERPTYEDKNGKTYVGICHHLIPDPLDYRPANLLCWLTREQHTEADRRQRALRKVLPDMHAISYEKHRYLQDPRITTDNEFAQMMVKYEQIAKQANPTFDDFDSLYRGTALRSTRITREERARAKAVWDHMTAEQRTKLMLRMNAGVGIAERMDYTLAHFVGRIKN